MTSVALPDNPAHTIEDCHQALMAVSGLLLSAGDLELLKPADLGVLLRMIAARCEDGRLEADTLHGLLMSKVYRPVITPAGMVMTAIDTGPEGTGQGVSHA